MDYIKRRHSVTALQVHLIFTPKYRKRIFTKKHIIFLQNLFHRICLDLDSELIECNGEDDHFHLLISYPPKIAISSLVNVLKSTSSRLLKKEFPEIKKSYWTEALWSRSYYASSVGGAPIEILKQYIENQNSPQ